MKPKLAQVYADESGETHLAPLAIVGPERLMEGDARGVSLQDIPTTTMRITQLFERRQKLDLHPAPRRQLVIVLQGEFQITTTNGDSQRFKAGDCLLAEDTEGKGHVYEDVGDERIMTIAIGIPGGWEWPGGA